MSKYVKLKLTTQNPKQRTANIGASFIQVEDISNQSTELVEKKSAFEYFTEIIGWIQIVASPFLTGLIIGALIYFPKPNRLTLIIAIVIATIGLTIGVIWATKIWRKKGTMHFMSRIMATPEVEKKDEGQN